MKLVRGIFRVSFVGTGGLETQAATGSRGQCSPREIPSTAKPASPALSISRGELGKAALLAALVWLADPWLLKSQPAVTSQVPSAAASQLSRTNHVLELDGNGSYLELPPKI